MAKYINTAMAIEALEKGLDVWAFESQRSLWHPSSIAYLISEAFKDSHFAIGEKPTSPPRKMIEIDGVRMPAPIMRVEDCPSPFSVTRMDGYIDNGTIPKAWSAEVKNGNVFATEADAIAARDARKLILKRAMECAK